MFEKSLHVSESSEENEAAEAMNDETLAEYPQEVTSHCIRKTKRVIIHSYPFDAMLFSIVLVNCLATTTIVLIVQSTLGILKRL